MSFAKVMDRINKLMCCIIGILMGLLILISLYAVFARSVLQSSLIWSDELLRYLFVWMVFIGSGVLVDKSEHLSVDIAGMMFPPKLAKQIAKVGQVLCFAFFCACIYVSIVFIKASSANISPAMMMPMSWVYVSMPVGFVLMALNSLRRLIYGSADITENDNVEAGGMGSLAKDELF